MNIDKCRAFKNKTTLIQCTAGIKNGLFCGKHQNFGAPAYDINGCRVTVVAIAAKETDNCNKNNLASANKSQVYKNLENSELYNDYLATRSLYMKEKEREKDKDKDKDNDKDKKIEITPRVIDLLEYMGSSKLELYPYPRILATLEYYKLIKPQEATRNTAKFLLITENLTKLESLFGVLIRASAHLDKVIKLQKWIKCNLTIFKRRLHGPALVRRGLCVNDSDFVSLDDIKDILPGDFISFQDAGGFIYGFSLDSIVDLIMKSDDSFLETFKKNSSSGAYCYRQFIRVLYNHYNKIKINNPYTRDLLSGEFKLQVFRLYARKIYSSITILHGTCINKSSFGSVNGVNNPGGDLRMRVRNKCFTAFQKLDMFGYMTDINWLMDENVKNLKLFYKKLAFQWNLEFGLNNTARYRISRTHNLFGNLQEIMLSRSDKYHLLDKILDTMNILVSNGETEADKNTGAIIILYGLAAINRQCIEANPWLG